MKRLSRLALRDWIGLALVLAGFVLRLRQYLVNRSLWLDEAMLSDNIVSRSFGGLTQWLDYDQQAPIGFLWSQKISVLLFGNNEYALRLIPFLAGCAALVLMYALTRRLPSLSGNTALALFSVSNTLVYYTSEAKQYILDAALALGLLVLFLHLDERGWNSRRHILFGMVGALVLWFSHPAIFTLAGIGILLLIKAARQKSLPALGWTLLTGGMWLASFAAFYVFFLRRSVTAEVLLDYWGDAFLPLSLRAGAWLVAAFNNYSIFAAGLETPLILNFALALIGLILLARRAGPLAAALGLPALLVLGASAVHAYPFAGRMLLFLSPLIFILLAEGLGATSLLLRTKPAASSWTLGLLAVTLIFFNAQTAVQNFATPKMREHIRPTMESLREHRRDGDLVYVYYWAEPAVRFYAPKYGFSMDEFINGADHHANPELYRAELEALRGRERVWFLFSHVYEDGDFNERDFILSYVNSIGELSREVRFPGTSVYLYLYDLQ
jgi:4-amino-4-deoxy-L-arabinose transferase-like glycosyltransferase